MYLKNIDIEKLENGMIISIAQAMGYKYDIPKREDNKYFKRIMTNTESEYFWEEEDRINKKYYAEFMNYLDDVIDWLEENNYLEVEDDS